MIWERIFSEIISEKCTGNIAKRRLLVNPSGPEIQTEFCDFLGEKTLNSEKGGIYESPPDRCVPNSSPARITRIQARKSEL